MSGRVEPLKPCPFCGARRPFIARGAHCDWVQVRCSKSYEYDAFERGCGGRSEMFGGERRLADTTPALLALHEAQARFNWNRRDGVFSTTAFVNAAWERLARENAKTRPR